MRTCGVLILVMCFATSARAQETAAQEEHNGGESPAQDGDPGSGDNLIELLEVNDEGWGAAVVTNLFAAHFDGTIGAFSSGVGFGFSYKLTTENEYPFEFGFFMAPQLQIAASGLAAGSVAALLHANLFKGFGVGIGYDFFRSGKGFVGPSNPNLFFTLGYGITNRKD